MFKNKKESTGSKHADSKIESGSAPFSNKLAGGPIHPGFVDDDIAHKPDPNLSSEDMDDIHVPPLRQDTSEDGYDERNKAMVSFDTFTKAIIKVFTSNKQVMVYLMLVVKNFMDRQGYFLSLRTISNCICDMINSELKRQRYFPFFIGSFKYKNGVACNMWIKSYDKNLGEEFYLHDKNYENMFFSATYMEKKNLMLHVHADGEFMKPVMKMHGSVKTEATFHTTLEQYHVDLNCVKKENIQGEKTNPTMFCGCPIDMTAQVNPSLVFEPSTLVISSDRDILFLTSC